MIAPDPSPTTINEADVIKFPPWPAGIPQFGHLVSFKDFEPMGLLDPDEQDESDSDREQEDGQPVEAATKVERDGEGVPTVDIQVNHDPNRHVNKGRKRKATKQGILRLDDLFGIGGEEPVATRGGIPYDPAIDPLTRVYRATKEWEVSRKYALGHTYNLIWVHWMKYAQVSRPLDKKADSEPEDAMDEDDELEDEDGFIFHPEPEFLSPDAGGECRFLASIVGTVRTWLSHEFKHAGLAWLDGQLRAAPLVTRSYLSYLLAHGVLPERMDEIEEAIKVCRMAENDMMATKDVAVAFEDGFNKLCSRQWGAALEQERNFGWSTAPAYEGALSDDGVGEGDDDDEDVAATAADLGRVNLEDDASADEDGPPVVFVAKSATDEVPSLPPAADEYAGSGWDIDVNEPSISLNIPPPPLDSKSSSNETPSDPLAYDDGGWGVSPALLVDPKAALFPLTSGQADSVAILSHPCESYTPAGEELSLRRVVAVSPTSTAQYPELGDHELARSKTGLGALVLERWTPVPSSFTDILSNAPANSMGIAPSDAYVGSARDTIVVWVNELAVKDRIRAGMGIFGKFIWVSKNVEGGSVAKGDRGFWFVEVEDVIAEYWLGPDGSSAAAV